MQMASSIGVPGGALGCLYPPKALRMRGLRRDEWIIRMRKSRQSLYENRQPGGFSAGLTAAPAVMRLCVGAASCSKRHYAGFGDSRRAGGSDRRGARDHEAAADGATALATAPKCRSSRARDGSRPGPVEEDPSDGRRQDTHKHPLGKSGKTISKQNYEQFKDAITSVLRGRELTHAELVDQLNKRLKGKFSGNVSWYAMTVKLDLEARKLIVRTHSTPQRYRLK
jgi:hypothetical protein